MALRRLLQGSVLPPTTGRAAATEQFSTASGGTITATLFPGDGIGPEIAESVKQSGTKNVSLGTEAFWFGQQRKSGVGFVGRYGTKKMGLHYARLSSPFSSIPQVDRAVGNLERSSEFDALKATRTRSAISKTRGEAMMFPLHFHYEDVLRQDLLLKLNHDNVMQVPGLFEIRLVPKAASDLKIQIGKLAMEILCGQRFVQTQKGPSSKAGKSNPFLAAEKDAASAFARQSVLRGHGMYHFLVRLLTAASMLDSPVKIQENSIKMSMEMEFCEFSPELEDHFEIFENIRGFNVTIVTSANTKDETLLLWSGILQKDEGGN